MKQANQGSGVSAMASRLTVQTRGKLVGRPHKTEALLQTCVKIDTRRFSIHSNGQSCSRCVATMAVVLEGAFLFARYSVLMATYVLTLIPGQHHFFWLQRQLR